MSDPDHTWVITISNRPIEAIVLDLINMGCIVKNVLKTIGVVTVVCDENKVDQIRRLSGVDTVEHDYPTGIGLPHLG